MLRTRSTWKPLGAQLTVVCLLGTGLPNLGQAAAIVSLGDSQAAILAEEARPTLDTDAVLEGLKAGKYSASGTTAGVRRGPWRKVGRTLSRIGRYGPLAGVVGHKKNMRTGTKVLIGVGVTVAVVAIAYVVAVDRASDTIDRAIDTVGDL